MIEKEYKYVKKVKILVFYRIFSFPFLIISMFHNQVHLNKIIPAYKIFSLTLQIKKCKTILYGGQMEIENIQKIKLIVLTKVS